MNEMIKDVIKNMTINDLREMKAEPKFNTKGYIYCIVKLEDGEYKGIVKTYKQQSTAYDCARKLQYKSVYSAEHEKYFIITVHRSEVYDLKKEEKVTNEKVSNEKEIKTFKKHDISYIRKIMNELDRKTGNDTSDIPVKIVPNNKKYLACYKYWSNNRNPESFEFTYDIVNIDDQSLIDTIKHEYAHYIQSTVIKSKRCGHNQQFKNICKELGTDNYGECCTDSIMTALKEMRNKAQH